MNVRNMGCKPNIFLFLLFLGLVRFSAAQNLSNDLSSKLSSSDQKKLQKAEELFSKGKKIEDEIPFANKDERKYQLKRLEAADYYQTANSKREEVFSSNINSFWKKYTGEKKVLEFAKKAELTAADSFKRASQLRRAVEKERKISDQIALLVKAENLEHKSLIIMEKVLYTYLNWPIEYDHVWVSSEDESIPNLSKKQASDSINNKTVNTNASKKTTTPSDSVTLKKEGTNAVKRKPNVIIVKPKTAPVVGIPKSEMTNRADTSVRIANVPSQKPAETTQVNTNNQSLKPVSLNIKDTISSFTNDSNTIRPLSKETIIGNDSSLYGKVQVKEDQIDKFNEFLKKKYPSKMEDYVINFQDLDYTDINALREAWYKYQYGYLTEDSTALLAARQDSVKASANTGIADNIKGPQAAEKSPTKDFKAKNKKAYQSKESLTLENTDKESKEKPNASKTNAVIRERVPVANEGFIYRIQIVACRVPLDERTLHSIYSGTLPILELNEDNWYKYAIGEFSTYKAARKLRDQSKIPGVFVIAYLNGKRIKITPAMAYSRFADRKNPASLNADQIRYYVQVAASKINLSDTYLKNIYNGPIPIEIRKDDGWNKYVVPAGRTFREASEQLKKISVPGAFVVAYQNDTRIEVQHAARITE